MKYLFLLAVCFSFSCRKDLSGHCGNTAGSYKDVSAVIVWDGPIETDGCGWAILINNVHYHPDALATEFRQDQLNVVISYDSANDHYICGIAGLGMPVIHITQMRVQ